MESYLSLLNLNFMSSLRTDNILLDMLLATLIPLVSSLIYNLIYIYWPHFLKEAGKRILFSSHSSEISFDVIFNSADLDENEVLSEAVMQYIAEFIAPVYPLGNYNFKRIATSGVHPSSIEDAIRNHYHLRTVPSFNLGMKLTQNLTMFTAIEEEKSEEAGETVVIKREKLCLSTSGLYFSRKDPATTFVKDSFEWYKEVVASAPMQNRYFYQPLENSRAEESEQVQMKCQRYPLLEQKTFNTLFFEGKERMLQLLDEFQKKTGKFAIPGFPHKFVLLLYGPPGTGKTSLVKAIAQLTLRNILAISLSRIQTNHQLMSYMFDPECIITENSATMKAKLPADKVIYMLEDIDAASKIVCKKDDERGSSNISLNRDGIKNFLEPDRLSIKGLLEVLNGILDLPGRIIVMTTNHIDHLDPALTRPGLVTLRLHMQEFSVECALQMIRHYFGVIDSSMEEKISETIQNTVAAKGRGYSPAELEQFCAENDTVESILEALTKGSKIDKF